MGVQRGADVVQPHAAAGVDVRWLLEARLVEGLDMRGPYVHGRPGARFLYLSWMHSNKMFRRAKLMLDAVPANVLVAADKTGLGGRFRLTMLDGSPLCAAVRPPDISWAVC